MRTIACGIILAIGQLVGPVTGAGQVPPETFSLKISAGYSRAGWGDMNKAEEGHNARFEDLARLWGFARTGEVALPHEGLDFGAEILVRITPRLDVGLGGGGFIRPIKESEITISQALGGARSLLRWTASATVIPLTLNAYYRVPLSSRISGFLKGGLGCAFARLKLTSYRESELLGIQTWSRQEGRGWDYAAGFQAGLGLEYEISKALSCFFEGAWRFANFKNWTFEYTYTAATDSDVLRTASGWATEQLSPDTGEYYPAFFYSDHVVESGSFRNVRKAEIDFSGWNLQAGLRIKLGR